MSCKIVVFFWSLEARCVGRCAIRVIHERGPKTKQAPENEQEEPARMGIASCKSREWESHGQLRLVVVRLSQMEIGSGSGSYDGDEHNPQ